MIRTEEISFHIGTFELQRLSINIARGEYFILLGPPGSGKTIFLECLCGLKKIKQSFWSAFAVLKRLNRDVYISMEVM